MKRKFLITILASTILTGCSMAPNRAVISQTNFKNNQTIVFSTSSLQDCVVHGINLHLRQVGSKQDFGFYLMTNPYITKDFEDTRGVLHALQIPTGEYEFRYSQSHPYVFVRYDVPFKPFAAEIGEITYLGEIAVDGCTSINGSYANDKFDRDTQLLKKIYPEMQGVTITKGILEINTKYNLVI